MEIEIELPWPYKGLSPNDRYHWRKLGRVKKRYRADCHTMARAQFQKSGYPDTTQERIAMTVTFYPPNRHRRDEDNTASSFKAGQDGLADALNVDDNRFDRKNEYAFDQPVKGGKVVVRFAV